MSNVRVGWGFDAHRFGGEPPMVLGGVIVSTEIGIEATSDGDVVVHAVIDALLGAAALGDLGTWFPSSDPRWAGVNSFEMLKLAVDKAGALGLAAQFVDVTIVAQSVRVSPHRDAIRVNLAEALDLDLADISVKATSTDRMGWIGRDEGLAVAASVTAARIA